MPRSGILKKFGVLSPLWIFLLLLGMVFFIEAAIMLVVAEEAPLTRHSLVLAGTDAVILTVVLAPMLWVLVVRPLRGLLKQRGELLAQVIDIQELERARLSRDLHDELGQQLTAVLLGLRAVEQAGELGEARRLAGGARAIAAECLAAVRRIARGLAPTVLTDFGLRSAVERLCEDARSAAGLEVTHEIEISAVRYRPEVEIAVYRVLQESITNAVRHSGARQIQVHLVEVKGTLRLEVRDDGAGTIPSRADQLGSESGIGLSGMRERIVMLNGEFRVGSTPGSGTVVSAVIPGAVSKS